MPEPMGKLDTVEVNGPKPRSTDRLTGCACVDMRKVPSELG